MRKKGPPYVRNEEKEAYQTLNEGNIFFVEVVTILFEIKFRFRNTATVRTETGATSLTAWTSFEPRTTVADLPATTSAAPAAAAAG